MGEVSLASYNHEKVSQRSPTTWCMTTPPALLSPVFV